MHVIRMIGVTAAMVDGGTNQYRASAGRCALEIVVAIDLPAGERPSIQT